MSWVIEGDVWAATSATVTITPSSRDIQQIVPVPTQATHLRASLTRQSIVAVTGHQEQQARQARGILTFYNLAEFPQTIPAGTMATGTSGTSVITNMTAIVPAGNPPAEGSVDIPAYASRSGASGNLAAGDIWLTPCCANIAINGVVVSNPFAFTGGLDAARYRVVSQHDVDAAAPVLETALEPAVQDTLQQQVPARSQLSTPPQCTSTTHATPPVGSRAEQVEVLVTEVCQALAYDQDVVLQTAVDQFMTENLKQPRRGYKLFPLHAQIVGISVSDQGSARLSCTVLAQGRWVYQFGQDQLARLKQQLAGLTTAQAQAMLHKEPGVGQVTMQLSGGDTFPTESSQITLLVVPLSA